MNRLFGLFGRSPKAPEPPRVPIVEGQGPDPGREMLEKFNADLGVFEFLLEKDGLDEELIKSYCDNFVSSVDLKSFPVPVQARLMLRVLRDSQNAVNEGTINAINCLRSLGQDPAGWSPLAQPDKLVLNFEVYLQVKTEVVLSAMRKGELDFASLEQLVNKYFQNDGLSSTFEASRRNDLLRAIADRPFRENLLAAHPAYVVAASLNQYATIAREALGPTVLEAAFGRIQTGTFNPFTGGQEAPKTKKRGRPPGKRGAADELQQRSKQLKGMGGEDPLPDILQQVGGGAAQPAGPGPFSMAMQEAAGGADGLAQPVDAEGRALQWDSPAGPPSGPEGLVGMGSPGTGKTPTETKLGNPRRRIGKWTPEETALLIRLVHEVGRGKWKKILEIGGSQFQQRSQVDLKDKWRNLVRQGTVVDPPRNPDGEPAEDGAGGTPGGVPAMQPLPLAPVEGGLSPLPPAGAGTDAVQGGPALVDPGVQQPQ